MKYTLILEKLTEEQITQIFDGMLKNMDPDLMWSLAYCKDISKISDYVISMTPDDSDNGVKLSLVDPSNFN